MLEPLPYECRFQSERTTDRHEGKEPVRVIAKKPLLCLPRALDPPFLHLKPPLKTEEGIFKHGIHQRRLWTHCSEADRRVEKLLWEHADIKWPPMAGVPVVRRGLQ